MASKAAHKRLAKEYAAMQKEPPPFVWAAPEEKNVLHWHFIIRGPPDSVYANGEYHGMILFPQEYPFKPPGIKMLTPSGRFQPDKKICFSMSDFHPGSWNPAWSVATILTGLLSFMLSDEITTGSVTTADVDKRAYAARSHSWNVSQKKFREMFPDYCDPAMKDLPNMAHKERGVPDKPTDSTSTSNSPTSRSTKADAQQLSTAASQSSSAAPAPAAVAIPANSNGSANGTVARDSAAQPRAKAALGWGQVLWEKWRWGLLIAVAVVISRFSSNT